jgi:hypothetical protein
LTNAPCLPYYLDRTNVRQYLVAKVNVIISTY